MHDCHLALVVYIYTYMSDIWHTWELTRRTSQLLRSAQQFSLQKSARFRIKYYYWFLIRELGCFVRTLGARSPNGRRRHRHCLHRLMGSETIHSWQVALSKTERVMHCVVRYRQWPLVCITVRAYLSWSGLEKLFSLRWAWDGRGDYAPCVNAADTETRWDQLLSRKKKKDPY